MSFLADDLGQRALVGKVCMDRNNPAKYYKETCQESQEETCRWVPAVLHSFSIYACVGSGYC